MIRDRTVAAVVVALVEAEQIVGTGLTRFTSSAYRRIAARVVDVLADRLTLDAEMLAGEAGVVSTSDVRRIAACLRDGP